MHGLWDEEETNRQERQYRFILPKAQDQPCQSATVEVFRGTCTKQLDFMPARSRNQRMATKGVENSHLGRRHRIGSRRCISILENISDGFWPKGMHMVPWPCIGFQASWTRGEACACRRTSEHQTRFVARSPKQATETVVCSHIED